MLGHVLAIDSDFILWLDLFAKEHFWQASLKASVDITERAEHPAFWSTVGLTRRAPAEFCSEPCTLPPPPSAPPVLPLPLEVIRGAAFTHFFSLARAIRSLSLLSLLAERCSWSAGMSSQISCGGAAHKGTVSFRRFSSELQFSTCKLSLIRY